MFTDYTTANVYREYVAVTGNTQQGLHSKSTSEAEIARMYSHICTLSLGMI